ncbi:hypothetical protein, partial [Lactiplantibacillus fabifermentans]|uniref:hypothetical protein n=1 Tax=Lactiplantibacillus fabifermentans TaxID=483011 RepID=UPI001C65BCE6
TQVSKGVRGVNGIQPNPVNATCMAASITVSGQLNGLLFEVEIAIRVSLFSRPFTSNIGNQHL